MESAPMCAPQQGESADLMMEAMELHRVFSSYYVLDVTLAILIFAINALTFITTRVVDNIPHWCAIVVVLLLLAYEAKVTYQFYAAFEEGVDATDAAGSLGHVQCANLAVLIVYTPVKFALLAARAASQPILSTVVGLCILGIVVAAKARKAMQIQATTDRLCDMPRDALLHVPQHAIPTQARPNRFGPKTSLLIYGVLLVLLLLGVGVGFAAWQAHMNVADSTEPATTPAPMQGSGASEPAIPAPAMSWAAPTPTTAPAQASVTRTPATPAPAMWQNSATAATHNAPMPGRRLKECTNCHEAPIACWFEGVFGGFCGAILLGLIITGLHGAIAAAGLKIGEKLGMLLGLETAVHAILAVLGICAGVAAGAGVGSSDACEGASCYFAAVGAGWAAALAASGGIAMALI